MRKNKFVIMVATVLMFSMTTIACSGKSSETYRSVKIEETEGITEVKRTQDQSLTAYEGMKLTQGDDVYVTEESSMVMQLDDDQYVFADAHTKFHLDVSGKKEEGKVQIVLSEGSVLIEIQNKLSAEEVFEVTTPNATMAVRGTVFYVETDKDETGEQVTKVSVFQGEVAALGDGKTEEEVSAVVPGVQLVMTGDIAPKESQEDIQLEKLPKTVLKQLSEMEEKEGSYFKKEELQEVLEELESGSIEDSEEKIEVKWQDSELRFSGTGMITDEILEKLIYEVFVNKEASAFSIVIEEGITGIDFSEMTSNKDLEAIGIMYGVTAGEINYQLFDLMTSITLPKSITLINIPGMPTGDELNLNVIVQEDSYAQEWAKEQGFEISYYSE